MWTDVFPMAKSISAAEQENLEDYVVRKNAQELLQKLFDYLDEEEKFIIGHRYGLSLHHPQDTFF
ncbi:hypothetical protein [Deferribacter desulfuricans]|uniref:hypothetical protein n=1 Tax=Deferribacter desulfuricans TaxID=197162 RepID=UPI0002D8A5E9|nr:hypothetical protein [Deferribacter desulfuricans]